MSNKNTKGFVVPKWWHFIAWGVGLIPAFLMSLQFVPILINAYQQNAAMPIDAINRQCIAVAVSLFLAVSIEILPYLGALRRLTQNLQMNSPLFERVHHVSGMKPYSTLLDIQISLENLAPTFSLALDHLSYAIRNHNGLVVITASNSVYLEILRNALYHGMSSFYAIITMPYTPWWFFENEHGLSSNKKLSHLEEVSKSKVFKKKCRLLLYNWDVLIENKNGGSTKSFANLFIEKIDKVHEFLNNAGQFPQTLQKKPQVEHFIFDWEGYKATKDNPPSEYLRLFEAIDEIIVKNLDFATIDNRIVIQKRRDFGLQVIPLQDENDRIHQKIFKEFELQRGWWIPLTKRYLEACKKENKMLGQVSFSEWEKNN